jgi:fumarate reductase subunit D
MPHAPEKRSNAPVFWLLFGAGGTLSALFGVGLILVTGFLAPQGIGIPADALGYENALAFTQNWLGKAVILAVISLFFWHAAERFYLTLKDMHVFSDTGRRLLTYGVAALVTVATAGLLLAIGF